MSCRIRIALPFMSRNAVPLICLMSATLVASADQATLVTNGNFEQWAGGVPVGWKVEVGARNGGEKPVSEVKKMVGPALMMRGDESTMAWRSVSQSIKVKPGGRYRLTFQGRSKGVRREGRQYDNCYVGVISFDGEGERVGLTVEDLSGADAWKDYTLRFVPPAAAAKTDILIFLSKSGTLQIKNLRLGEESADRPFR